MFSRFSLLSSILLLVGSVVAQNCDYCSDVTAKLSPECIEADPAIGEIIARESSCGRIWDAFCIVEYNDCYNQACGVENQQLINEIAATGGPGDPPRGLNRQQILANCPPSGRVDTPRPTPSPTACPPGGKKGSKNGGARNGYYGKKGGKNGGSRADGDYNGKKGGKNGGSRADGDYNGKKGSKNGGARNGYYGKKGGKNGGSRADGDYNGKKGSKNGGARNGYYGKKGGKNGGSRADGDCYNDFGRVGYYSGKGGKKDGSDGGRDGYYGGKGGKKDGYVEGSGRVDVTVGFEVTETYTVQGQVEAEAVRGAGFVN